MEDMKYDIGTKLVVVMPNHTEQPGEIIEVIGQNDKGDYRIRYIDGDESNGPYSRRPEVLENTDDYEKTKHWAK